MIRVFQADDHELVRKGIRFLLMGHADIELIGEAADGDTALTRIRMLTPDVVLLDLHMPGKSGTELIPLIKEGLPQTKILVVTSFGDNDHVFAAIKAGADGYLLKDAPSNDVLAAIRDLYAGHRRIPADIAIRLLQEMKSPLAPDSDPTVEPLTERELDTLKLVARGYSNQEIAEHLSLSESTVRAYVSHILGKLHVASRTQATLYALRTGIASLDD